MAARLSAIEQVRPELLLSATLSVPTAGAGFIDITRDIDAFLRDGKAGHGTLLVFLRHTSASLTIQENADPDVQADLLTALSRLAPEGAGWVHDAEGPDDMPAHVKAMLTGVSLTVPVKDGAAALGIWQGIYLIEHRRAAHRRDIMLQFIGSGRSS
jgi:secondary thiamine-phosphate synthase enzyme